MCVCVCVCTGTGARILICVLYICALYKYMPDMDVYTCLMWIPYMHRYRCSCALHVCLICMHSMLPLALHVCLICMHYMLPLYAQVPVLVCFACADAGEAQRKPTYCPLCVEGYNLRNQALPDFVSQVFF